MRRLRAAAWTLAFLPVAAWAHAASPDAAGGDLSLQSGFEAREVLGAGLGSASLEALHDSAFQAQGLMQGLDAEGKPAVDARSSRQREGGLLRAGNLEGPRGLRSTEPPFPRLSPDKPKEEPPKQKRDWEKIIMKWLPIAVFYYMSVVAILNPVGSATMALRSMAMFSLIGTATLLYKELFKKKK